MPSAKKVPRVATAEELSMMARWDHCATYKENIERTAADFCKTEHQVDRFYHDALMGKVVPPGLFDSTNREAKRQSYTKLLQMWTKHLGGTTLHADDDDYDDGLEIKYVGLPAGYSTGIEGQMKAARPIHTMDVIEKDRSIWSYISFKDYPVVVGTRQVGQTAGIYHEDIFSYLMYQPANKYNLFDLDLMCHLNVERITKIVEALGRTAEKMAVLNLVTSYGHGLTTAKYEEELRPILLQEIGQVFKINVKESGKYCDRHIPMKYEHIAISRE
jgi:hypothetical protein